MGRDDFESLTPRQTVGGREADSDLRSVAAPVRASTAPGVAARDAKPTFRPIQVTWDRQPALATSKV